MDRVSCHVMKGRKRGNVKSGMWKEPITRSVGAMCGRKQDQEENGLGVSRSLENATLTHFNSHRSEDFIK